MFFIDTTFDNKCKNSYPTLFDEIDRKIYEYAKLNLNNIRYGFKTKIDQEKYEDLIIYKEILEYLIYCSDCLCNINIDVVVSKIRKLTNSIC